MSWTCHQCGRQLEAVARVGRRDACPGCGADLHCCLNCRFHDPGAHNQCREPQAERQVDKLRANFCEYFSARTATASPAPAAGTRAALDALFAKKARS